LDEAGRRGDGALAPAAAFLVAAAVQRRDAAGDHLAGFLEHGDGGFAVDHLGQAGQLTPQVGDLEYLVEDETHVTQGRLVISHVKPRFNDDRTGRERRKRESSRTTQRTCSVSW